VGIDRGSEDANAEAETTDAQVDRRPPLPRDSPGAGGHPTRADSRHGAAVANEKGADTEDEGGDKLGGAQPGRLEGRLTVKGKQVNEHLDPLGGADTGKGVVGEPWTDPASDLPPAGAELPAAEDDNRARPEKLRKKFFEVVGDAHEITGKAADKGHAIFARQPTGHAETSTAPEIFPAPHEGVNAGDLATGLFVLGTLVGEGVRRYREKSNKEEEE
jgi:hypothetical protein